MASRLDRVIRLLRTPIGFHLISRPIARLWRRRIPPPPPKLGLPRLYREDALLTFAVEPAQLGKSFEFAHGGQRLRVTVPQEIGRGINLRLAGKGGTYRGRTGDLYVRFHPAPVWDVWVAEREARTGTEKRVRVRERVVRLTIPPGAQNLDLVPVSEATESTSLLRLLTRGQRPSRTVAVRVRVYPETFDLRPPPLETLSADEIAAEGHVYRYYEQIQEHIRQKKIDPDAFTVRSMIDVFNERGWLGVAWQLRDGLRLQRNGVTFLADDELANPGCCETTVARREGKPPATFYRIRIKETHCSDPFAVTAILAHELSHLVHHDIFGLVHEQDAASILRLERTVDLIVFLLGLGEFQIRVHRESRITLGYFNQSNFHRIQAFATRARTRHA